jgi:hypothetical protein
MLVLLALCVPVVVLIIHNMPPWRGDIIFYRINYGDFRLSGVVVDQDDVPVYDLDMYVIRSWVRNLGLTSDGDNRTVRVNGAFDVSLRNCSVATLLFEDPRYYYDRRAFTQPGVHSNLRIVLQKLGKRTTPADYRCLLRFSADNSGNAVDFAMQPGRWFEYKTRTDITRSVSDLSNPSLLPRLGMYMLGDVTADGRLATIGRAISPRPAYTLVPCPKRLVLVNTDPEGGFIRFTPQPDRRAQYQMFQAPTTGYEPRLILDTNDVGHPDDGGHGFTWFYFKIAGKYGRGDIGLAKVSADGRTVELDVTLLVQPDGTNNLEFVE